MLELKIFYGIGIGIILIIFYVNQLEPLPPFFGNSYYQIAIRKNYLNHFPNGISEMLKDLECSNQGVLFIELKRSKKGFWFFKDTENHFIPRWSKIDFSGNWNNIVKLSSNKIIEVRKYDISHLGFIDLIFPFPYKHLSNLIFEART